MQHSSGSSDEPPPAAEEVAGRELRRLRVARGWSQEEAAERMKAYGYDWHQTTVGRIEAAQRPLRLNEAVDLASLYGVSLNALASSGVVDFTALERQMAAEMGRVTLLTAQLEEVSQQRQRAEVALWRLTEDEAQLKGKVQGAKAALARLAGMRARAEAGESSS